MTPTNFIPNPHYTEYHGMGSMIWHGNMGQAEHSSTKQDQAGHRCARHNNAGSGRTKQSQAAMANITRPE